MRPAVGPLLVLIMMASSVSDAAAPARAPAAFLPLRSLFGRRRQPQSAAAAIATRGAAVPSDLVGPLREAPWRTGLEPAENCDLLEAPTVEVRSTAGNGTRYPSDRTFDWIDIGAYCD